MSPLRSRHFYETSPTPDFQSVNKVACIRVTGTASRSDRYVVSFVKNHGKKKGVTHLFLFCVFYYEEIWTPLQNPPMTYGHLGPTVRRRKRPLNTKYLDYTLSAPKNISSNCSSVNIRDNWSNGRSSIMFGGLSSETSMIVFVSLKT